MNILLLPTATPRTCVARSAAASGCSVWLILAVLGCRPDVDDPMTASSSEATAAPDSALPPTRPVVDLSGEPIDLLEDHRGKVNVMIFSRTDCPISRRYAPEVRRLCEEFTPRDVQLTLVFPNAARTADEIRAHLVEYAYPCDAVKDPDHVLVAKTGATITPEAAVFDRTGKLVYVGRIDDRSPKLGVLREPSTRDLADAIEAVLDGREPSPADGPAVGCYIVDLRDDRR